MLKPILYLFVLLLTVGWAVPTSLAQDNTAIKGVATDSNGAVIAGAAVVVKNSTTGGSSAAVCGKPAHYEFKGVIKSVNLPKRQATIKHEEVKGLMEAMTMPFLIKDLKALEQLKPGDQIKATLIVTDDGAQWLEKVVITAKGYSQNRTTETTKKNINNRPYRAKETSR